MDWRLAVLGSWKQLLPFQGNPLPARHFFTAAHHKQTIYVFGGEDRSKEGGFTQVMLGISPFFTYWWVQGLMLFNVL